MSATSTVAPPKHVFDRRVEQTKCPKSDINSLILDYLTMEGYSNAAENFSKEANLRPMQESESMRARQEIRQYILSGNIQEAVDALNELDPEILDSDHSLHFALLRLQLIELIRDCHNGDVMPAINFATSKVAPRTATSPKFLEELEQTMALVIIPHDKLDAKMARLLNPDMRREVAYYVNKAILQSRSDRRDAAIIQLVKMRVWAEQTARSHDKNLPIDMNIGIRPPETRVNDSHESMMM